MPFGVSCAPRALTKLMRDVLALLRQQCIRLVIYLDDMLVLAASKEESRRHTHAVLRLLFDLGLSNNVDKSALTPSRSSEFLDFLIDTRRMQLFIPAAKRRRISDEAQSLLDGAGTPGAVTCRSLARFLGWTQPVSSAVRHAALHWHGARYQVPLVGCKRTAVAHGAAGAAVVDRSPDKVERPRGGTAARF
jgi:hypothetical protein